MARVHSTPQIPLTYIPSSHQPLGSPSALRKLPSTDTSNAKRCFYRSLWGARRVLTVSTVSAL
eukprot:1026241-Pyramimonas_sp.AAC.1